MLETNICLWFDLIKYIYILDKKKTAGGKTNLGLTQDSRFQDHGFTDKISY